MKSDVERDEKKILTAQQNQRKASAQRGIRSLKAWQLIGLLVVAIVGTVSFVAAVGGWFGGGKVSLSNEYYCGTNCDNELVELSKEEYEKLMQESKSFVVFVDQDGCTTADRLRTYISNYAREAGIVIYRISFEDVRESALHDYVKYYPSVVIISRGGIRRFLRADADEDAIFYNEYDEFKKWMNELIKL